MRQNKIAMLGFVLSVLLAVSLTTNLYATGKITGRVYVADTNEPLIGTNIVVVGTMLGAATDMEGYYVILNVEPGTYQVQASMMGYKTVIQENVMVRTNQTTTLDFTMSEQVLEGETVTIVADRPVIQMDVSSSQKIVTAESIEDRPLENFEEILASEAGISLRASEDGTGLVVRGGGIDETNIVIDGLSTRDARTQQPVTTLNLTAIKEIEILTGGFNAEFGGIRSGMINVTTREGSLDRYSLNFDGRISPPARKHFGPSPFAADGVFWRVHAGPDAFTGVTQDMVDAGQYPFTFIGWNKVAEQFISDPDPNNDMTPQALQEVWKWQHRIRKYADKPDYIGDVSFSGRIPMTPVTFLASQRYENLQLVYPFSRNSSVASSSLLKLIAHLTPSMKLSFNNSFILRRGVSGDMYGDTRGIIDGSRQGVNYGQNAFYYRYIWHDAAYNPVETQQYRGGFNFTHVLSAKTFYDIRLEFTDYQTVQEPIGLRDTTKVKQIGSLWYDEAPFGYVGSALGNITEQYDILGDFLMSGGGRGQDHSSYWGVALSGDIVSQINKHNELKAGFTFDLTSYKERREINHGATTTPYEDNPGLWWYWNETPIKFGGYLQDKLEFQGMIANVGLRVDALKVGYAPYNLDPQFIFSELPYTLSAWRENNLSYDYAATEDPDYKLYFSPRLGISHPVTATSKIFFNYGHFFQPPVSEQLYNVKPSSSGGTIPNAKALWPKTVAWEIGIEKSVANDFLVHFMGYYKDVSDQLSSQTIVSIDAVQSISTYANNSYADIRGLEMRLEKRMGRWWYGWLQGEYSLRTSGRTGLRYIYEDRQLAEEQREVPTQSRGTATPSLSANITLRTPADFGPRVIGINVLGDWRLNVLQEWSQGGRSLMNPEALLDEQHYAREIDWWNTDLLLEKRIQLGRSRFGLFMQVKNLFNYRGFPNPRNWNAYVDSLHFPWETGEQKGNDKLGEWDKDYIDLGWNDYSHFINPRDIYFGLRVQF